MAQSPVAFVTLEAFLRLPETKPACEYIDGRILQKPMPQGKHSTLQAELVIAVDAAAKPRRIARAFPELRCTFDGRSVVPDIAVFAWERIPIDEQAEIANVFDRAPDWTIEMLSPEQSQTRVTGNILHCLEHGCRMGWLVDPAERSVLVYPPGRQPMLLNVPTAPLPVPEPISDLRLSVGEVFGWLSTVPGA
ncbi:Uma2 family endonuclease [Gloeobacter violaceus]|uniref:Gll1896 protein n=1 Tax=Gloeobacter violaceus (strain ATCC 29082 / PCC 7421) TaxID=251221 RepID=Q7NJD6_GLOVI|nr:Uma2 family endonuclease [Gloeobacter violaceus]BAC89837.1 gll1896 [Gloeobacter violaceus PCC 7421]